MTRLVLIPVFGYGTVAFAAFLLLALWFWSQRSLPLDTRRTRIISALRLAVILLVVTVLLRPTLVYTRVERQAATIALLVDGTRSMLVADSVGNRTRWDEQTRTLTEAAPALAELGENIDFKAYRFDRTLTPLPL